MMNRILSVDYGVQTVPYDLGMLPDAPPMLFGKPARWDGLMTFGKHRGKRLSSLNAHYISWAFQNAASRPNAPGWLLQLLWTWGLALLTKERIEAGDRQDALCDVWCNMRAENLDLPAGGWDGRDFWQPEEYEEAMGEILQEALGMDRIAECRDREECEYELPF